MSDKDTIIRLTSHMKTPNERLKFLRLSHNLTAKELADEFGVTQTSIYNYEKGDKLLYLDTVAFYSKKFNVSTDWIIFGKVD